jgi:hypothetical protein
MIGREGGLGFALSHTSLPQTFAFLGHTQRYCRNFVPALFFLKLPVIGRKRRDALNFACNPALLPESSASLTLSIVHYQ